MAVSITQRPAAWVPILNPVIYKFATTGGPFTNYRIAVEVFRASDNTSITGGVKFNFSPNLAGVTIVDVGTFLRNYLRKEYISTTSEDQIGSTRFYIKYQEFYTGSATSLVNDSANQSNGAIGAIQILGSASYAAYIPGASIKKFIYNRTKLKAWYGYPFTISYLKDTTVYTYRKTTLTSDGVTTVVDATTIATTNNSLAKVAITPGADDVTIKFRFINPAGTTFNPITISDEDFDAGGSTTWTNTTVASIPTGPTNWGYVLDGGNTTRHVALNDQTGTKLTTNDFTVTTGGRYRVTINAKLDTDIDVDFRLYFLINGIWTLAAGVSINLSAYVDYVTGIFSLPAGVSNIGFYAYNDSGATRDIWVDYIRLDQEITADLTEEKTIDVLKPCKNPVYLFFKNSLNGDCYYLFEYVQEYSYTYSNGRKAKRATLSAPQVTLDEWNELNDMNTPGEVFMPNISELTTSVDKTALKSDQQVYQIMPDGSKIGVIVITRSNNFLSSARKSSFEIDIEYPSMYL